MGLNIIGIVGIAVCGVSIMLACVSVGIHSWATTEISDTISGRVGLWKLCAKSSDVEVCTKLELDDTFDDDQKSGMHATRAFVIIGIVLSPVAIAAAVLVMFVMKDKEVLWFASAGVAFASGLMHMIGFAVYAGQVKTGVYDSYKFGAAFALTIVAWILNWVVGGLFIGAKMMKSKE